MATRVTRRSVPAQEPEPERLYTYEQIAEFASASASQVKRWCDEGKLRFVAMPQGRRITLKQWEEFVRDNSVRR